MPPSLLVIVAAAAVAHGPLQPEVLAHAFTFSCSSCMTGSLQEREVSADSPSSRSAYHFKRDVTKEDPAILYGQLRRSLAKQTRVLHRVRL